ncbi:MAG: PorT family protein [Paludibacteraceae bacterium]|nr:PorT family protein [Paludibacteraceae bacterium]
MLIRKLYVFLWVVLLVQPIYSQQLRRDFERELSVGVTGGLGLSRVSFLHNNVYRMNELGDQSFCTGYRFGAVVRFISQNHFGIQLEANYVRSGWSELYHEDSGSTLVNGYDLQDVTLSRRNHYLEIPALAHIYFGKRKVRFFVELGPEISFMMGYGDLKWNIAEGDTRKNAIPSDDPRLGDVYNNVDYGLTGGLGLDFLIGRFHTIIGGRYTHGFADLYNNGKADVFQRSNNQLMNVTATFLIPVLKYTERKR